MKHVFKDYVFIFNENFEKTNGTAVEKAENLCVVSRANELSRKSFPKNRYGNSNTNTNAGNANSAFNTESMDEELVVGKSIIIKTGALKGYQGVIRTVNKDRIEVRVPSKGCSEWVPRDNLVSNDQNNDFGKTPHRGQSMTNMYAPSPMNYN